MEEKANMYQNGKIYIICDNLNTKRYYGSTIKPLSYRMSAHKRDFKEQKKGACKSSEIFEEFGPENCKIELIESYPCASKSELERRESYYIINNECVNKRKEWCDLDKLKYADYKTFRCDYIKLYRSNYDEEKKQAVRSVTKEYRERNKDAIAKKKQERNANTLSKHCACGGSYKDDNYAKSRHLKSLKHIAHEASDL